MASTIVTKNSSTASAVPVTGDLTQGELAVNVTDKKLYTKDSGGTVVKLVGGLGNQEANAVAITGGSINGTTVGATTASTGAFTTLSASSTVSGTGFSTYLASPPAIGGTAAAAGSFTTLSASSTTTLSGGTANGVAYLNGSKVVTTGSALVFDGTNLGIGTSSPGAKLHVANGDTRISQSGTGNIGLNILRSAGTTADWYNYIPSGSSDLRWFLGADLLTLTSSGNLGLGVTPSAWSQGRAIEVGGNGYGLWYGSGSPSSTYLLNNAYFNSGFKYGGAGQAAHYYQYQGAHVWSTAPSGTAGNAITFTQAMTLDASGRLLVGTTTATDRRLSISTDATSVVQEVLAPSTDSATICFADVNTSTAINQRLGSIGNNLGFWTGATERARITSGGELLVGTTSTVGNGMIQAKGVAGTKSCMSMSVGANGDSGIDWYNASGAYVSSIVVNSASVAYNTSSDRRLKENIAPAADAGAVIDAIEVVQHDWKVGGHIRYGMIAQDLHAVAPEAVSAGDDGDEIERTWGVDYSKLVPMLIKEIQSLRARVAALEAA